MYKDMLKRKYPDSHMAKLLTNPNYINELEAQEAKIEDYYSSVLEFYKQGKYSQVIREADRGMLEYPQEKDMLMRLSYLRAMSTGAVRGKEAMKVELDSLVAHYPGTEIAAEAQEVIDYMYVAFPVFEEIDQAKEAVELYVYEPEAHHYFLIALKKSQDLNLVNFNLLNYNLDNFNTYDLEIELTKLEGEYNMLMVQDFSNIDAVRRYMQRVETDITQVMGEIPEEDYEVLLISEKNYLKLQEAKDFMPYKLFYRDNYLK
jgi:hypothetical protein